jgi:hypothetical protein
VFSECRGLAVIRHPASRRIDVDDLGHRDHDRVSAKERVIGGALQSQFRELFRAAGDFGLGCPSSLAA